MLDCIQSIKLIVHLNRSWISKWRHCPKVNLSNSWKYNHWMAFVYSFDCRLTYKSLKYDNCGPVKLIHYYDISVTDWIPTLPLLVKSLTFTSVLNQMMKPTCVIVTKIFHRFNKLEAHQSSHRFMSRKEVFHIRLCESPTEFFLSSFIGPRWRNALCNCVKRYFCPHELKSLRFSSVYSSLIFNREN